MLATGHSGRKFCTLGKPYEVRRGTARGPAKSRRAGTPPSLHGTCSEDPRRSQTFSWRKGAHMTVQIMRTVMAALIAALAIFWAATDAAAATLVDNGTFTTDTATGLDWLDVTQTQGLSYNAVTSLFGSTLAGWQFATLAQVSKLYDDAGGAQP